MLQLESKKILTDANLYQSGVLDNITTAIEEINDTLRTQGIRSRPDVQLVLELTPVNDGIKVGYYFVDHDTRCLFWLEPFDIKSLLEEVKGASSPAHIKHEIEAQYWLHWSYFPDVQNITFAITEELEAMILHSSVDALTSPESTAPYAIDDLTRMFQIVNHIDVADVTQNGYLACAIGRLMNIFMHGKFLHFHGQDGARLSRDQSIYGDVKGNTTLLMGILSPLLFYAPDVHLRTLESIWVDRLTYRSAWRQMIGKLRDEWIDFTLYNTIILTANVAFLAIPSVDGLAPSENGARTQSRSLAQNASYVSILTSVGSIVLALLLIRQNLMVHRETPAEAARFLQGMTYPVLGLEVVAIMYSLPFALLMWGVCSFLVAFLCMCLETNKITQATVGSVAFVVCMFVLCCICTAWERGYQFWIKQIDVVWEVVGTKFLRKEAGSAAIPTGDWRSWLLSVIRRPNTNTTGTRGAV